MAALVVRSSEEKSLLSGLSTLAHPLFQPDKVSRITRAEDPSSLCPSRNPSRSSRKSKAGVKKQPQRGLGVAQLEKLRLQEQSKQDAACLASLGLLHIPGEFPPPGHLSQGICFPHHHHHHHSLLGHRALGLAGLKGSGGFSVSPAYRSHEVVNAGVGEIGDGIVWTGAKEGDLQLDGGSIPVPPHQQLVQLISASPEKSYTARRTESEVVKLPVSEMKVQLFDPGSIPVHRRELSMIGIPKELSSFQTKFPGGNNTHNNTNNQVWQAVHSATSGAKRPCVLLQDNPRVLISVDHGEIVQTEPADGMLKSGVGGAHYTPRSISNALGKSTSTSTSPGLPFLKPEEQPAVSVLAEQQQQYHHPHPADSMSSASNVPFLQRKRCMPFSDSNNSASKKAATSGVVAGCGSDFLALSLSISHTDVVEAGGSPRMHQCSGKSGDDSSLVQRSLSLQETVTDVDEGSQKSPSSYSMDNEVENMSDRSPLQLGFSYPAQSCGSSGKSKSKRNSGVDLSLKLAI